METIQTITTLMTIHCNSTTWIGQFLKALPQQILDWDPTRELLKWETSTLLQVKNIDLKKSKGQFEKRMNKADGFTESDGLAKKLVRKGTNIF